LSEPGTIAVVARNALVGLGVGPYLLGWLAIAVGLGAVTVASVRLRAWLVPWRGAPARIVEVTVGVALVMGVAFVLGGIGWFAGWPVLVALVVASLAVAWLTGVVARPAFVMDDVPTMPSPRLEWAVAAVTVAVVLAQWISHTAGALGHGMTEGDTLWYHGVFAARFVQEHDLAILPDLGKAAQAFFPANSQVLHAVVFFPFDRDVLSILFNLVFAPIALLAAYCAGRRRGLGALCVTASAIVLGLPGIVGVHPGQATNDVLCATFLLVALALVLEGGVQPLPLGLAGVAAALSLGTKLTVSVPLTVLTICIVVVAVTRRRPALVVAWLVPLGVFGAFWFIRNWALVDNPLPFYDLHLGPLHFPDRTHLSDNASIADHLFERDTWSRVFRPGLRQAFGRAWVLICATPGVAGLLAFGRRRTTAERVVGLGAVAAGIGYVYMPFTMELGGAAFAATARYGVPSILVGVVLLPLAVMLDRAPGWFRGAFGLGFLVVLALDVVAPDVDRFAPWGMPDRPIAIGVTVVLVAVALGVWLARRHAAGGGAMDGPGVGGRGVAGRGVGRRGTGGRAMGVLVGALGVVVLVVGGFFVQRHYLEHRYVVGAGLRMDRAYQYVNAHEPETVVPFQTIQFYPFFGPSFANRVLVFAPPLSARSGEPAVRCREWQQAFRDRRVTLIAIGPDGVLAEQPVRTWLTRSRSLRVVEHDARSTTYRVTQPVRLACPPA
jgi:hypothetical protein